jgi:hypothetical protein
MNMRSLFTPIVVLSTIAGIASAKGPDELRAQAEQFFRGVYGGDSSVVDKFASEKIVISYPIFEKLFKKHAIRGRDDVKKFAVRFGSKWTDTKVTIHDALVDGNKVVLIWSFQARFVNDGQQDQAASKLRHWGGMSFFRFDDAGKIEQEIGEESEPGPIGRLLAGVNRPDGNDR